MPSNDGFMKFLLEQLAPLGHVTARRMFGKRGLFCDGVMFAMVAGGVVFVRVDEHNREALKEAAAMPPLSYMKAGELIDLAFWRIPDRLFDEPDELITWARSALGAAKRVAIERSPGSAKRPPGTTTKRR